jgi:hypothetical protein
VALLTMELVRIRRDLSALRAALDSEWGGC